LGAKICHRTYEPKREAGLRAASAVLWWRRPSPGVGTRTSSRRDMGVCHELRLTALHHCWGGIPPGARHFESNYTEGVAERQTHSTTSPLVLVAGRHVDGHSRDTAHGTYEGTGLEPSSPQGSQRSSAGVPVYIPISCRSHPRQRSILHLRLEGPRLSAVG
jgi:hypothetical protein